jgi:hypothetical protein
MARSRRHRSRSRSQRGGELAGNPPSSWGWGLGTAGDGWKQFMDSLTVQPGQNANINQSNNLVPVSKGGRRRSRGRGRSRRGGSLGAVISQAAVPLTLLAAQQTYGRRRTRRHRRR